MIKEKLDQKLNVNICQFLYILLKDDYYINDIFSGTKKNAVGTMILKFQANCVVLALHIPWHTSPVPSCFKSRPN